MGIWMEGEEDGGRRQKEHLAHRNAVQCSAVDAHACLAGEGELAPEGLHLLTHARGAKENLEVLRGARGAKQGRGGMHVAGHAVLSGVGDKPEG